MTLEEANRMMQEFMMKFMKLNQDVIQMLTEAWIKEVKMQDSIYPGEEQVNSKYLNFKDSAVRQGAQHI